MPVGLSIWEHHGQSIVAAIVLGLLMWNANTTYGTKLEVTAMRANLDATLEAQRGQLSEVQATTAALRLAVQSQEVRVTVMERAVAELQAEKNLRRDRP